jgi:hypothetical protein
MIARLLPIAILGGILAAGAAGLAGYHKGGKDAEARCDAARLSAELAAVRREFAAYRLADQVEAMLAKDAIAERDRLEKEVADYEQDLARRPDGACRLSDDDVRRLPGAAKREPGADRPAAGAILPRRGAGAGGDGRR